MLADPDLPVVAMFCTGRGGARGTGALTHQPWPPNRSLADLSR